MISHRKLKKISIWLGACLTIVIIFAALSIVLAKELLNRDHIKEEILSSISAKIGGGAYFEDISVHFFYRPHVILRGGKFSVPEKLEASFETLTVYPKLIPLIKGDVEVSYLKLVNPSVKVILPEETPDTGQEEKHISLGEIKSLLIGVLEYLDKNEKDSMVEIENGNIRIVKNNEEFLNFSKFNAIIVYPNDKLNIDISTSSNISNRIVLEGWINTVSYDSRGSIRLTGFYPHKVINMLRPGVDLFKDSGVDLTLGFDVKELDIFNLSLKSPSHYLTLTKGGEELKVSGKDLDVDIYIDEERSHISLNKTKLLNPALSASGRFEADKRKNEMTLSIEGKDIEVESSRKGALLVAGDNHVVDIIFKIVKGGKIPEISLEAKGSSFRDLFRSGNYVVKGKLEEGAIFIPGAEFDLYDARGDAVIADGVLRGTNLSAKMGNSRGSDGTIIVGIEGSVGTLNVDIMVDADLAELPPLLKRFVHDEGFQEELALITNVEGRATGKLVVGDMKKSPKVSFYASAFDVTAEYGKVPYSVKADGGKFNYSDKSIDVEGLNISVGNFFSNGVTGSYEWKDARSLKVSSSDTSIDLSEFFPWLASLDKMKKHLEHFQSMRGSVHLSPFNFAGPILTPEEWRIESSGAFRGVSVNLRGLDEEIKILDTDFKVSPDEISFPPTKLETGDSFLSVVFNIWDYVSGSFGMELNFSGTMDADTSNVVLDMVKVPQQISILSGVSIADSSVILESNNTTRKGAAVRGGASEPDSTKEYKLDINITADSFEWVEPDVPDKEPEAPSEEPGKTGSRVYGKVTFSSDEFIYKGFSWDTIDGDVGFMGHKIDININNASLCGISTPGYFEVSPPGLKLDFKPNSRSEDLSRTIDCLLKKVGIITGEYDLDGNIYSNGNSGSVVESLEGELRLSSSGGYVQKYGGLAKFLTVLNFGEIFRGNAPDFGKDGFPYNFLTVQAQIKDGKMNITRAAMDGPSLKVVCSGYIDLVEESLDLEILVIPVLAVDSFIEKIPLLSYVIGEKSSSIPIKVTGSLSNPKFSKLSPHAIKSGLLTIIKETLNIPVTIIKPVKSSMEKERKEELREKENGDDREQD